MAKQTSSNHGEGDPEAAERFNSAEKNYVNSARGRQQIAEGPKVRSEEAAELDSAEKTGKERAKGGEDPQLSRK